MNLEQGRGDESGNEERCKRAADLFRSLSEEYQSLVLRLMTALCPPPEFSTSSAPNPVVSRDADD